MSVVPLIEGKSFVTTQGEFTTGKGASGCSVLILNFDRTQLSGKGSNVSYDLRVGPKYRDHRREQPRDLMPGGQISLEPGSAVIIQTEEEVHFPQCRFGYVVPKVRELQRGLSNTMSKVDPGYHGPLLVTLFNLGGQKVTVGRSDPFCTLVVHQVAEGAKLYEGAAKQIEGQPRTPWERIVAAWNWLAVQRKNIGVATAVYIVLKFAFHFLSSRVHLVLR